ncbi:MAG TPA: selenium-dependent molybdenum cofactor biosynthesis protein YqeB [Chloroflexota bacterium]|nr:selenium-dependent molybdenum cofactor biosynthesis protein YqeB [Chloroflexota bacterium]
MRDRTVVIRGGGDLGSGVALRLWRCGFLVVILERPEPLAVRRTVAFSEAVYDGTATVEEAAGRRCLPGEAIGVARLGAIPVVVDPGGTTVRIHRPGVLVDAILAKVNTGTALDLAPLVIGLGPGFFAGDTVHAVVETNRGPDLGRVIWKGAAEPNTGTPGLVSGVGHERVLRAPAAGALRTTAHIGEIVGEGDTIAEVEGQPVSAPFRGLLRGLLRDGARVATGMKVGDLDPRLDPRVCEHVSDKALAVAGGVLEAILSHDVKRG